MPEEIQKFKFELLPGATVESTASVYIVGKCMSDRGIRAVYLVRDVADLHKEYAMKVERKCKNIEDSKLKREVLVLKVFSQKGKESPHFPQLIDRGKKERYNFVVLQLAGMNLADLKANRPLKVFTAGTGLELSRQCLSGLSTLHNNGYVHRDIKLTNFALGPDRRTVLVVDVGLARRYLNAKGEIAAPRQVVGYKGSVKFAPLSGHRRVELGAKDDCESWLYMLLDMIAPSGLPWSTCTSKDEVGRLKETCRAKKELLYKGIQCGKELGAILDYLDKCRYEDRVDYDFIIKCVHMAANVCKVKLDDPYDFHGSASSGTPASRTPSPLVGPLSKKSHSHGVVTDCTAPSASHAIQHP